MATRVDYTACCVVLFRLSRSVDGGLGIDPRDDLCRRGCCGPSAPDRRLLCISRLIENLCPPPAVPCSLAPPLWFTWGIAPGLVSILVTCSRVLSSLAASKMKARFCHMTTEVTQISDKTYFLLLNKANQRLAREYCTDFLRFKNVILLKCHQTRSSKMNGLLRCKSYIWYFWGFFCFLWTTGTISRHNFHLK